MASFSLGANAHDRVFPRADVVSCLRNPVPLGSRETPRIQRMVESQAQEGMARITGLHDAGLANGASPEPADACEPVAIAGHGNCVHWVCPVGHVDVLENPSLIPNE